MLAATINAPKVAADVKKEYTSLLEKHPDDKELMKIWDNFQDASTQLS
jgi:hypothetical protein